MSFIDLGLRFLNFFPWVFCDFFDRLLLCSGRHFGRSSTSWKVHYCAKLIPFGYNGSHCGSHHLFCLLALVSVIACLAITAFSWMLGL